MHFFLLCDSSSSVTSQSGPSNSLRLGAAGTDDLTPSTKKKKRSRTDRSQTDTHTPGSQSSTVHDDFPVPSSPSFIPVEGKRKGRKRKLSQCSSSVDSGITMLSPHEVEEARTDSGSKHKKHKKHKAERSASEGDARHVYSEHSAVTEGTLPGYASAAETLRSPKMEYNADDSIRSDQSFAHGSETEGQSTTYKKHKKHRKIKQEPDV